MGDRDESFNSYEDEVNDDSHSLLEKFRPLGNRKQLSSLHVRCGYFMFIHIALIILYTAGFLLLIDLPVDQQRLKKDLVNSPAQDAVSYERVRFNATLVIDSPYNGGPSPEVDTAWDELLQYMNIEVSKAELDQIHADSIGVPGTEMFVGGLGVYHELHCLKRLRQYTWQDYYHANATDEDKRLNRLHTDHCIDILRQAILCHADVSLFTLEWSRNERIPRADFSHEHTCKDWRRIFQWAGQRSIPEEKMQNLQHPIYGSAFPDKKGSALGASEDHSAKVHE